MCHYASCKFTYGNAVSTIWRNIYYRYIVRWLTVIELNGKCANRCEHFFGETLNFACSLCTVGEAGTVKIKIDTTPKLEDHGVHYQENSYTPELQVYNTYNTTMHGTANSIHEEYNTSENEHTIEIETIEQYGEKIHETEKSIPVETSQVLTVFNKTIHHEDDSSDDKSVIEIESPEENKEQEIGKQDKPLTTTFQIEIENRKVEGLITYSTDQQIFKFKVNSWGVNIEFTLYELKCTINAIL